MSFAVAQYRSNQVQTASPARVIVQFYDGALKFVRLAVQGIEARDYAAKGMHLSRAHAIVSELRANLDPTRAPELCAELDRLYVYVLDCITEANIKTDATALAPAVKVLEQLRAAWAQVADEGTGTVRVIGTP
ncbi:MAG TPA: flagellar export chaperone FliS [Polyangiaceae bacterium]|nr:flagellar export chaperone FliS [Polyangiaceae bacterium]